MKLMLDGVYEDVQKGACQMLITYILIFFVGSILGSFYHVVGYRMPIREDWVSDRSRCPGCSHKLRFYELMPVFSYVLQGGKCRSCGMKIKPIYLLSEIVAGFLFIFPVWFYGVEKFTTGEIYVAWAFLSLLIIITVSDIYYQLILDRVLLFFGVVLVILYVIYPQYDLVSGLIGAGVGFLTLYVVGLIGQFLFKKETLGGGDIKLYAVIGFVLGISSIFLSLFLAAVLALIYILMFMKDKTKPLGFGPFIAIASYLCLFYGSSLLNWYFNLFL